MSGNGEDRAGRPLDPAVYWHLKALIAEREQCFMHAQLLDASIKALMATAGLDVSLNYALDDAACSATPRPV
jgi:hypothetical protein